jgi:hypothetical protein
MLEAATRRNTNTGNRLNYSGNNLPSYKNSFSVGPLQCYQQSGFEKTKDRLMRLCLQVSLVEKKKSEKLISLEKDNIKLVEIDVKLKSIAF